jgi:hypothetical protein
MRTPSDFTERGQILGALTPADGAAGKNFLTPAIHAYATRRLAQGTGAIEPFRLLHNMLSSHADARLRV